MKNGIALLFAGIIGGGVATGLNYLLAPNSGSTQLTTTNTKSVPARFTNNYGGGKAAFDFTEAAAKSMPAVVHIRAKVINKVARGQSPQQDDMFEYFFGKPYGGGVQEGTGSGVIVKGDGYIVTNNHVVEGANDLEVTLFDKRKYKAKIIGTDATTDLAVIKIEEADLPTIEFGNSDDVKVGEWAVAVGNPFNLSSTVTAGIISAKGRNIDILHKQAAAIESFIQTDAAVNPGNSGGALVDINGRLIGINAAIASETGSFSGYSFAIPVNLARKVMDDIIEFGSPQRGFLGINIIDIEKLEAEEKALVDPNLSKGVCVVQLVEGGSAIQSGVKRGDVVVGVNDKEVGSAPELQELVGRARPGDVIKLTVNRKGQVMNIDVKLKR